MAEHGSPVRLTVVLNASLPLERLLLEKIYSLSKATQQQWLRSLLVEGWLIECRMLQLTCGSSQGAASTGSRFALKTSSTMHRDNHGSTGNNFSASLVPVAQAEETIAPLNRDKPLAYLKRVLG
ncbi:unnamed protein product [Phaeothamnion confervicola]